MLRPSRFTPYASLLAISAATCSVPGFAQETSADRADVAIADPAAADAQADTDDAIVVTAQRRAQNIQDVPISMAAFSGDNLAEHNVVSVADLPRVASNFQATRGIQSTFLRLSIRGIGAAGNTTIEPSVAAFVDGIYVPRPGAIVGALLDMDSVEVLRGPQGTLFGRNASVGALSLHTATPRNRFEAEATGEIANGDRYRATGMVNIPVSDHIAVRVAGMSQWFGGYWTNALDGRQYGGLDEQAVRATVRADLGNVEWIVRGDYSHSSGDGFANVDFDARSVSATQLANFRALLGGRLPDTNLDDRILNQYVTADLEDTQWGVSSTLSYDSGIGTFKLINSYRDWQDDQLDGDVGFTPVPLISRVGNYSSRSQNHELQYLSPTGLLDGHLDLVAGLYYFSEDYRLDEQLQLNSQYCNVILGAQPLPVRNACNGLIAANGGAVPNATDQDVFQSVSSYAAYAQATYNFSDRLALTLGGRWTQDDKEGTYSQLAIPFAVPLRAPEALTFPDHSESRFTYRVSLNWRPNEDTLFFANHSTGYKSGGYNSGGSQTSLSVFGPGGVLISTRRVFDQETVDNYELGARTSLLDRALTANITFYRMDISGFQDRAFDGTGFTVRNAGSLRHQGFELDLTAAPTRRLTFTGSLAYLDSAFRDYPNAPGLPGLGGTQDLRGKPVTFAPEWSGRLAVDWNGNVGSSGLTWAANANLAFSSDFFGGIITDANPQTIVDGYATLGARVTLNGANDRWSLSLFGNNLADSHYLTANLYQFLDGPLGLRNGVFPGSTAVRQLRGEPRTYGVSATVRF